MLFKFVVVVFVAAVVDNNDDDDVVFLVPLLVVVSSLVFVDFKLSCVLLKTSQKSSDCSGRPELTRFLPPR